MTLANDMTEALIRKIQRRNPFKVQKVPWLARLYAYPFNRWEALGRQALFGAPNFVLFLLFQKLLAARISGTFHYHIQGTEKPINFDASNTQFSALYLRLFAHGYEPHISALVDVLMPPKGVFYDVGSNWGWFSLLVASQPGFAGKIHAFEPYPPTFRDLQSTVEQAGLLDRIQCHQVALSDREGEAVMRLPDHFQSGQATLEDTAGGGGIHTSSLDSLGLESPSLMKMDVEGVELKVLNGGRTLLARAKPMIVMENGRSPDPGRTLAPLLCLRELGYEFYQVGWLRKTPQFSYFVGDDADPDPQESETLALIPFTLEERFLRPSGMNLFACHKDRKSELETHFEHYRP